MIDEVKDLKETRFFSKTILMKDGARPHAINETMMKLHDLFGEHRLISRRSKHIWPPRSPDLNLCDFFLWEYLEDKAIQRYVYQKSKMYIKDQRFEVLGRSYQKRCLIDSTDSAL